MMQPATRAPQSEACASRHNHGGCRAATCGCACHDWPAPTTATPAMPPLDAGGTVTEWGVLMCLPGYPDDGNVLTYGSEVKARERAYLANGDKVVSRTVTTWTLPDGATLVRTTPWAVTE